MVEGGGLAPEEGRPWRLERGDGASREAVELCLTARPEEDGGGRSPAVWERRGGARPIVRGVGRWAERLGPAGSLWPEERAGWLGWKIKEKGNPFEIDF
jgi:hypothetical protein